MIEDLRFVTKYFPAGPDNEKKAAAGENYISEGKKILQAYDGHEWFDVPYAGEYNKWKP